MSRILFGHYDCGCKVLVVSNADGTIHNYVYKDCRSDSYNDIEGFYKADPKQFEGKTFYDDMDNFPEFLSDLSKLVEDGNRFSYFKSILNG